MPEFDDVAAGFQAEGVDRDGIIHLGFFCANRSCCNERRSQGRICEGFVGTVEFAHVPVANGIHFRTAVDNES